MLTDKEIEDALTAGVREGKISWLGYKKDEHGYYTLPVLSKSDMQAARVIEAAATAPLLKRIAKQQVRIDTLVQEVAVGADVEAVQRARIAELERQLRVAKGEEIDT